MDTSSIEQTSLDEGVERFMQKEKNMAKAGVLGTVDSKLVKGSLPIVSQRVEEELDTCRKITSRPFWFYALEHLDSNVVAYIGLNHAFIGVGQATDLTNICMNIGKQVCVELWSKKFEETDPKLHDRLFKMAKRNHNSPRHRLKAMSAVAGREGHAVDKWTHEQLVNVGQAVLNCAMLGSHLFEVYDRPKKKFYVKNLGLSEIGRDLLDRLSTEIRWMSPIFKPMLSPPRNWEDFDTGCYHNEKLASLVPLIRRCSNHQKKLTKAALKQSKLSQVLRALNAIQSTPLTINKTVLKQVELAWERGDTIKKFPRRHKLKVPGKTKNWDELDFVQRKFVKKTKEKIVLRNRAFDADAVNVMTDINIARELSEVDQFFLPHNLDFRGRVYPIPTFNHQRSDHIRAMFQFGNGKKLDAMGVFWLKINVANSGDFDKISKKSFDDRIAWVNEHKRLCYLIGKKPGLTRKFWQQADKPFSFLAACTEFAGFTDEGADFVSHLPPPVDGANSGVQHYCAALRDREGGATVNLTSQGKPADVYQIVADQVKDSILQDTEDASAQLWLDYGVGRKVVKRNVMTFAYSSEKYGFKKQQMEDLMKPLEDEVIEGLRLEHPFGDDNGYKAASYMAGKVWDSVNIVVQKAAEGMRFIQRCAQLCAHETKPLIWVSPIGLPIVHSYEQWNTNRVRIFLYDKEIPISEASKNSKINSRDEVYNCIMLNLRSSPKGTMDKMKQRNAAAPNFIHSLDASHLMKSVNAALDAGITDFMLIHDSFATHAIDTETFSRIIREQFVEMYETNDVMHSLYETTWLNLSEAGRENIEEAPTKGTLDLREVIDSKYAFA